MYYEDSDDVLRYCILHTWDEGVNATRERKPKITKRINLIKHTQGHLE